MSIKKRVINKVADVLSYPKRTLYDAKRESSNRLYDSIRLKREKLKAHKESWGRK
jgi:hypothetical protein